MRDQLMRDISENIIFYEKDRIEVYFDDILINCIHKVSIEKGDSCLWYDIKSNEDMEQLDWLENKTGVIKIICYKDNIKIDLLEKIVTMSYIKKISASAEGIKGKITFYKVM